MIPRLIFIFVFFMLVAMAVKKGMSPKEELLQRAPGYPAPVALKKAETLSEEEILNQLPSAADYAFSMQSQADLSEPKKVAPKIAKRTVANKSKKMKLKR